MNDTSIESTCPDCGERFEVDLRIGGRRALEQHKRRCAGKPNVVQHFAQQAYEHALRQDQERFASGDWRKHLSKRCSCSGKAGPASRGELCASCPKHTAETYEAMMAATAEQVAEGKRAAAEYQKQAKARLRALVPTHRGIGPQPDHPQPKTTSTSWDVGEIVLTQQDGFDFGGVA